MCDRQGLLFCKESSNTRNFFKGLVIWLLVAKSGILFLVIPTFAGMTKRRGDDKEKWNEK